MTRHSRIQISDQVDIFLFPENSPEAFLVDLIDKYGSVGLGIAISSRASSKKMIETLRSVTNGFLVFNAVYFEKQGIGFPQGSKKEELEKAWKMSFRWILPSFLGTDGEGYSLLHGLESVSKSHKIRAFLVSDDHLFMMDRVKEHSNVFSEDIESNGSNSRLVLV